jgi:hypothetical protein
LYYHSGECSFCFAILATLANEYPNACIVSVSASRNAKLIDFYLKKINFNGISLIDSSLVFFNNNQKSLNSYNLFLIDREFNIRAEGIGFDKYTKKKFDRQFR